jgi:hypothetical protein
MRIRLRTFFYAIAACSLFGVSAIAEPSADLTLQPSADPNTKTLLLKQLELPSQRYPNASDINTFKLVLTHDQKKNHTHFSLHYKFYNHTENGKRKDVGGDHFGADFEIVLFDAKGRHVGDKNAHLRALLRRNFFRAGCYDDPPFFNGSNKGQIDEELGDAEGVYFGQTVRAVLYYNPADNDQGC